jgi:CubicO group peptidase (beta-lactamase class C family)
MNRLSVPGVAVSVTLDGQDSAAGFGVTSVADPLAITDRTLFQVGSITKTFTATALMRLIEDGVVELDAPVQTYLPEFRLTDERAQRSVTIRHLLTHTAGWEGDLPGRFGRGDDALGRLVSAMRSLRQLSDPGAAWSYNNVGFSLAGHVVEVATGRPFEVALQDLVLGPLGMTRSIMFPEDAIGYRIAAGHVIRPDGVKVAYPWAGERASCPAGGLISTADDLLRWSHLHLQDSSSAGDGLVSSKALHLMRRRHVDAGSVADEVGLAWLRRDLGDCAVAFHMGDTIVHQTIIVLSVEHRFGIAILSNADAGARLCGEVTDWALRRYVGSSVRPPPAVTMSTRSLSQYRGTYESRLWRIRVRPDAGALLARIERTAFLHDVQPRPIGPRNIRLYVIPGDRVIGEDRSFLGPRGEFGRDESGAITWFRFFGRIAPRVSRDHSFGTRKA